MSSNTEKCIKDELCQKDLYEISPDFQNQGIASLTVLRNNLDKLSKEMDFENFFPPIELCSDNGAMIAWAGIERFKKPSGKTRFKSSKLMQDEGLTWDNKPKKKILG